MLLLRLVVIDLVMLDKALTFFFYKEATGFKVKSLTWALSVFVI